MGSDVVGPGMGYLLTSDHWEDLWFMLRDEHREFNRTIGEADQLYEQLRHDFNTFVWAGLDEAGRAVGFVALHLGRKVSDKHVANLRIYLTPAARGNRLGDKLLDVAFDWAKSWGITRIVATPYLDGTDKVGFFERHGFKQEGVAENAVKVDERLIDVAMLARVA